MAGYTIENINSKIRITDGGGSVRNIFKSQIIDVRLIRTNVIKIDIGQGPLNNIFIYYLFVTSPVTGSPEALRDAIANMLDTSSNTTTGGATEANQLTEITKLSGISSAITGLSNAVQTLDDKLFYDPIRIDESGVETVYKGYCIDPTPKDTDPMWSIQRIVNSGGVLVYTWANGTRNFDCIWNNRETYGYQ